MSIHAVLEEIFKEEILEKRKEGEEIDIKGKKGSGMYFRIRGLGKESTSIVVWRVVKSQSYN